MARDPDRGREEGAFRWITLKSGSEVTVVNPSLLLISFFDHFGFLLAYRKQTAQGALRLVLVTGDKHVAQGASVLARYGSCSRR